MTDQPSIPDVIPRVPWIPLQLFTQMLHPTSPKMTLPPPKSLTADHLDALLQMQRTDPFCKCISKRLLNGKAPHHEFGTFTHVKGLLYKHITDAGKKFLALVIPKSWKFTILVEAHDKLGHQGKFPHILSHQVVNITGKA